jgi:hypothetical protein
VSVTQTDGAPDDREPFLETRAGGLFFLNAVLAGPAVLVLWPVLLRALLGGPGAGGRLGALLDPVPAVAAEVGPYIAWLSAIPLVTTLLNLRMPLPGAARWTLRAFALVHVWVLAWWTLTVLGWRLLAR